MRDYLVTLLIFGSLPFILARPYIGVLVWSWLSYMNPHRMTWGFAYDMPFAQIVAITLFASMLFSRDVRKPPMYAITWLWLLFIAWMGVTTANAIFPDAAMGQYIRILKIQLIIFLTMMIIRTPERLHLMVWVIFLSIGFFGIKGGVFTILTGGAYRVWGPLGTFIEDNNYLATALLMILPLGYYLYLQESRKWVRRVLIVCMVLIVASVAGSYSRGAIVAIAAVAVFMWWKSRNKLMIGLGVIPALIVFLLAMPASWQERMASIADYQQDESAQQRINSWKYSYNVANDRVTGAGLESWSKQTFARWAPDPNNVFVAHSIYFATLADHGWIGLLFFLTIFLMAWRTAARVIRAVRDRPEAAWMADLAKMIQVSMVAYAAGGLFLSLAYFDLSWHLVAILVIMRSMLDEETDVALPRGQQSSVPVRSGAQT